MTTSDTLNDRSHLEVNRERYQLYQYEIESDQEQDDNVCIYVVTYVATALAH